MMKILIISIICFINIAAQTGSITGIVVDSKTGLPVPNVYLLNSDGNLITATNSNGEFILPEAIVYNHILFSHLGYKRKEVTLSFKIDYVKIKLEPSPIGLSEITVLSTRHEKLKKEISVPVEIVDEEKIFGSPALTPSDLLKNEPGISLSRDGIWGTYASIRGLTKSSIVSLIDGNRIETSTELSAGLSLIDVSEIKQIEVIKSSASSLYGSGALGGIINIITNRNYYPEHFGISGRIISSYSSVNKNSSASLMLNTGDELWFVNFKGALRNAGNTQTPDGPLINSQFRNKNYSFSAGVKLLDNQELNINYQNYEAKDVGIPGAALLFPSQAEVRYLEASRQMFSAKYVIKNLSSSLINISGEYFYQNIFRDVENIPHTSSYIPASGNQPARRVNILKISPDGKHTTNGIKLQSDWLFGSSHYIIAGVDIWQRNLETNRQREIRTEILNENNIVINSVSKIIGEKPIPDSYFRSHGFFIQDEFELFEDKLKITAGGRIDLIEVQNDQLSNPLYEITNNVRNDSPASQKLIWEAARANDVSWSGSLSFLYPVFSEVDLTFTIANSFRSPSLEERFEYIDLGNFLKVGDPDLRPEKGTFIDAGIRILQSDFTFTGNIFLNQLNDMVTEKHASFEERNALIKQNIGKARLYGFDFGYEYNFIEDYILYSVLSYVNGTDLGKKEDLPQIPPLNGRLGFRTPLFKYLFIDLSSTFFARQNKTAPGEYATPSYAIYDIYMNSIPVKYNLLSFQFYAGVENAANKSYKNHLSSNRGFILSEPGRNFFIKIKIDW